MLPVTREAAAVVARRRNRVKKAAILRLPVGLCRAGGEGRSTRSCVILRTFSGFSFFSFSEGFVSFRAHVFTLTPSLTPSLPLHIIHRKP